MTTHGLLTTMDFDLDQTDTLLSTTRAVRRRLDLERPVDEQLIVDCIDLAEQAPTGGNLSSRRWLVIQDRQTKEALAEIYDAAGGEMIKGIADRHGDANNADARVMRSAAHLAEHLADLPAIVLVCIWGEHDGRGTPGLFDSVIQSAWSFCLAARARGLGTAWTTLHLGKAKEVAELLRIPDGVTQIVMFPLAHTIGTDFKAAPRRPAREITYWNRWGATRGRPTANGQDDIDSEPGVVVERTLPFTPKELWPIVTDITLPVRGETELVGAEWTSEEPIGVGSTFAGHNELDVMGKWDVECFVTRWEENRDFEWSVNGSDATAGARWRIELDRIGMNRETRVRFSMYVGAGMTGLRVAIEQTPDDEQAIIGWRRKAIAENMAKTIDQIERETREAVDSRA